MEDRGRNSRTYNNRKKTSARPSGRPASQSRNRRTSGQTPGRRPTGRRSSADRTRMRRRRQRNRMIQLVLLIILVIAAIAGIVIWKRYSPSKEQYDMKKYYGIEKDGQLGITVDNKVVEAKGKLSDGKAYVAYDVVRDYINSRFYWDSQQQVMLYTLPTEEFQIVPESMQYVTSAGTQTTDYVILKQIDGGVYLDLEFVSQYTDMTYTAFEDPARVVVRTKWNDLQLVTAQKNSEIRQKGGIKSPIVAKVKKGDTLYLQEELDNWSRVATADGYSGYIKKEVLSDPKDDNEEHASTAPEYTNISKDYKINLAFHQVTSMDGNATLAQMVADAQGVNTISPTWFSVTDNNGTISSLASADYVNQAHAMGMEVWGLIDNFNSGTDNLTFLSSTAARANIIQQLMTQAASVGLDGINLDFESITEEQAPHYIQFVRELSIACRNQGIVFSIDDPVPTYSKHYDRTEQGIVADYVIIMGYDEHYAGSTDAGSVSSLGFVKAGIEDTLKEVPAQKVINAIPFYTRVWIQPFGAGNLTSEVLGMDGAANYISEHGMDTYWDDEAGQNVASVEAEDGIYTIWVEDEQSIGEKMKLIQENQLAGVAEWKLGFERASVWPVIAQYLQ